MPPPFLGGMPFGGEPEAPKGFRPISTTQAMMEYAAPIMAYVEDGTVADPNDALQGPCLEYVQKPVISSKSL
jgi:hypothetical protein